MSANLLTRMRFRAALWWEARLLPFRVGGLPLEFVLVLARPHPQRRYTNLPLAYIVEHVRRTSRRPLLMRDRRCLREGLLACRFLATAGYDPELHFGIDRTSARGPAVQAHCWVVYRGETVLNPPQTNMVPIFVFNILKPPAAVPAQLDGVPVAASTGSSDCSVCLPEHAPCPNLSAR